MIRQAITLISILITITAFASSNQTDPKLQIDHLVKSYRFAKHIPGIAVAIYANGQGHIYTYGYANLQNKTPITKDSIFELASISKVFTATLLAIQVQKNIIKLNDPIVKYLPALSKTKSLPIDEVTVHELATHTSSFPRDVGKFDVDKNDAPALMQALKEWQPNVPIGKQYRYSNIAFGLLGEVVANAAGKAYIQLLNTLILSPLNMSNTFIYVPTKKIALQAQGYNKLDATAPHFITTYLYGGGSVQSSASDMLQFLKANLNVPTAHASTPLLAAMQLAQKPYYTRNAKFVMGLGWQRIRVDDETIITKDGLNRGFSTFMLMSPSRKMGVVVLMNKRGGGANILGRMIYSELSSHLLRH